MRTPAGRATRSGARTVPGRAEGGPRPGSGAGPAWMRLLPPAVMLAAALWRITGPSYWRDEAATLTAVRRPLGALLRMTGHTDAVNGAYYVVTWAVVRLGGAGELVTRLPSALAMTVAAASVAAIGRRLISPSAGLASGLVFAAMPQVSRYAQDARSIAMVTALAATASYLLVRALAPAVRRRGWLAGYALCVGTMGLLSVFSLLLLAAHAVTVALAWRRAGGGRAGRPLAAGWLTAAAAGGAAASPVLALSLAQRGQISWIPPANLAAIEGLARLIGPVPMLTAACLVIGLGIAVSAASGRTDLAGDWPAGLVALCLPWLLLPPAVLVGVSFAAPVYVLRYVVFCAPAAALLTGAGLAALARLAGGAAGWLTGAAAFAVIAVLGLPAQLSVRGPDGHGTDIRAANAIVATARRPSDAVLYLGTDTRYFPAAYPSGFARLDDIAQAKTPAQAGNLVGADYRAPVVRRRLARVSRVWVVKLGPHPHQPALLRGQPFRLIRTWHVSDIWLLLYSRARAG